MKPSENYEINKYLQMCNIATAIISNMIKKLRDRTADQ